VRAGDGDDRRAGALAGGAGERIEIGGVPIEVAGWSGVSGGPSALVLLHEGLGSAGLWREFPDQLRAACGREVIAFSRFGHGRSGPPPRPRTPSFFQEEALEVLPALLAQLGVERPVLVGHSDGASIALIHAAHHPVEALALLAPHVFVEELTLASIRRAREEYRHGELRRRLARHHDDVDAAFCGWCGVWLDPAFRNWRIDQLVRRITAPMLLIQGEGDPYGTLAQLELIQARAHAPVQRLVLSGGHSPHRDHGPLVAERIANFLTLADRGPADRGASKRRR
jgi:pimeloyl-ACP methyl ester carboxylesterase